MGAFQIFRRLVGTPTGAARRGRCPRRPQAVRQYKNFKCTRFYWHHFKSKRIIMVLLLDK